MKLQHLLFLEERAHDIKVEYDLIIGRLRALYHAVSKMEGVELKVSLGVRLIDHRDHLFYNLRQKVELIETIIFRDFSLQHDDCREFTGDILDELSKIRNDLNSIEDQLR